MAIDTKILNNFFNDVHAFKKKYDTKNENEVTEDSERKIYSTFKIFDKPEEANTQGSLKPDTNRTQIGHKPHTELDTNRTQTAHKSDTKKFSKTQTGHKPHTEPHTELDTNRTQTAHKPDTKISISTLIGLQKKILFFIYFSCQKSRNSTTEPLTLDYIAKSLNIKGGSVKTTISRLEKKGVLLRNTHKNGRGGWSQYQLPLDVYNEIMLTETKHKLDTNRTQTAHKLDTEPNTEPDTTLLSSSNIYINNKTTTTAPPENSNSLSEDWKKIDCESLSSIGFGLTQLKQLQELKIHPDIIQTSIHHFAFSLEHNEKAKSYSNPLNVLMGILRKGQVWFEPDYRSAQELALETILKTKTAERERLKALEEKCHGLAFSEWLDSISEEDKKAITSKNKMIPKEVCLRLHFTENLWEQKKPEYGIK